MRLLNAERDKMRAAILGDVPAVDYKAQIEAMAMEVVVNRLPLAAKTLWNNSKTRGLLHVHSLGLGWDDDRRRYVANPYLPGFTDVHEVVKTAPGIVELIEKAHAQADQRTALDRELRINLASVGTHEEFAKRWPELKHYLPDGSEAKSANLPVTTALLDGLKAAGLQLDKEPVPA